MKNAKKKGADSTWRITKKRRDIAPDSVVAINPEVLCDDVCVLDDRAAGSVLFVGGESVIDAVVREVRLSVPAVER